MVPPTVSISASKTSASPGESVTFTVTASDDVGIASTAFTFNGTAYTLNASNQVTVTMPSTAGTYTAQCTVTDAAGNSETASLNVTVMITDAAIDAMPFVNLLNVGSGSYPSYGPVTSPGRYTVPATSKIHSYSASCYGSGITVPVRGKYWTSANATVVEFNTDILNLGNPQATIYFTLYEGPTESYQFRVSGNNSGLF